MQEPGMGDLVPPIGASRSSSNKRHQGHRGARTNGPRTEGNLTRFFDAGARRTG